MKKIIGSGIGLLALALSASTIFAGFDEFGYNDTAGIFNGTGSSWCLAGGQSADCVGIYSADKLVMKWNAEWDRGNDEGWSDPEGYDAWLNNEWNGNTEGGSGAIWHYKIVWVGADNPPCGDDGTTTTASVATDYPGYCVWGQFMVLMDQGHDPSYGPGHIWFAHETPNGYGAYW